LALLNRSSGHGRRARPPGPALWPNRQGLRLCQRIRSLEGRPTRPARTRGWGCRRPSCQGVRTTRTTPPGSLGAGP